MGFYIAKVMRFYAMSLGEILALTTRRFFWIWSQIHRVEAEEDARSLQIAVAAQASPESVEQVHASLLARRGETETYRAVVNTSVPDEDPDTLDPNFDREGLARLKALMG